MTLPTVSVAVPTLDRPDDLRRCLESIVAGGSAPLEVLVIDQSADDASRAVVEAIGDPLLRHVRHAPPSASGARNRAAELARGDYVAVRVDDAEVAPDWLDCVHVALDRFNNPDALFGSVLPPPGDDAPDQVFTLVVDRAREWRHPVHPSRLGWACHMVVRRDAFQATGGFDELLGPGSALYCAEDIDFNYRLLKRGGTAVTSPDVEMVHHYRKWRDRSELPRTWRRYSRGNAAFIVKHLRRGDPFAAYMLVRHVAADVKLLVGAVRLRSRLQARIAFNRFAGTADGLVAGWRAYGRR